MQALAKAQEASALERQLIRMQEQANLGDTHNLDLTFAVSLKLSSCLCSKHSAFTSYLAILQKLLDVDISSMSQGSDFITSMIQTQ